MDADRYGPWPSSSRSQAACELFQFHGGVRILRPVALEDAVQGLHGRVLQFGARAGIMDAPVSDQLMLERLVVSAIDDGVKDHGADRQLLHPSPRQHRRGMALGEAAAQLGRGIRARDVVEQIADIVGFHQMFISCHRSHYPRGVRTYKS